MTPRIISYKANQLLLSAGHVEVTLADYPHNSGTAGSSEVFLLNHYSTRSIFKYPDTFEASHLKKGLGKEEYPFRATIPPSTPLLILSQKQKTPAIPLKVSYQ